jgi:hypothetical protein
VASALPLCLLRLVHPTRSCRVAIQLKPPNAIRVEEGITFARAADFSLPSPKVTVDYSTPHWEGETWTYSIPSASGIEEISVSIIDFEILPYDPDYSYNGTLVSRDLVNLDARVLWVCEWVVACYDATVHAVSISQNGINAVVAATRSRLNANNQELQKRLTDSIIVALWSL